jgi:glycosyltransferase involved in cell wall biosynthesis
MPTVSIIVPCYNEQATIRFLLDAIYAQTYPRPELEVIIADGLSEDDTRAEIITFQSEHPDLSLCVVDSPKRIIPASVNQAIENAHGEIIIRMDAHSAPNPEYVERCVKALETGMGDSVGGVWDIQPGGKGWLADSIAIAASHPLGVGDAYYRHTTQPGYVDTVPFGAFYRSLVERIGMFDETLLSNEDYEFNTRIRQSDGRIWLDPAIRSIYFARTTLASLACQYWRYGYWKWRMVRRYPKSLRWRQALPPLFVLSLICGVILAIFIPIMWYLVTAEIITYITLLLVISLLMALGKRKAFLIVGLPMAITGMHLSWGSGFLWSIIANIFEKMKND